MIIVESYPLQIALQLGWLGLILLMFIWAMVAFNLLDLHKNSQQPKVLLLSFAALSLVAFMQPVWADVSVVFLWWSLFGLDASKRKKVMI